MTMPLINQDFHEHKTDPDPAVQAIETFPDNGADLGWMSDPGHVVIPENNVELSDGMRRIIDAILTRVVLTHDRWPDDLAEEVLDEILPSSPSRRMRHDPILRTFAREYLIGLISKLRTAAPRLTVAALRNSIAKQLDDIGLY